jgi:hypothetical protein
MRTNNWLVAIRRHERWLSVLGLLIIFCTFLIKDAWREHLKDVAASVESAEATFALTYQTIDLRESLAEVRENVSLIKLQLGVKDATASTSYNITVHNNSFGHPAGESADPAIAASIRTDQMEASMVLLNNSLESVEQLAGSIPLGPWEKNTLGELVKQVRDVDNSLNNAVQPIRKRRNDAFSNAYLQALATTANASAPSRLRKNGLRDLDSLQSQ